MCDSLTSIRGIQMIKFVQRKEGDRVNTIVAAMILWNLMCEGIVFGTV